jgi:hypothetical protein
MRPKSFSYTPSDDNLTGFLSNATGATWTLTTTTVGDGLAHQVTIRNDAATDHSAKTAVLVGTDADGRAITETLNLPGNAATVTSTKYYKTLTSVTPSATINADTMDIGWKDTAVTPSYPVNRTQGNSGSPTVSFGVDVTGTINFDAQATIDNIYSVKESDASWFDHGTVANATTDAYHNYVTPIVAMRLMINSLTSGATVEFHVVGG